MDAAVMSDVRRQRRPAPASCAGLQSRQFLAHAGDARANQRLVSDEPEGEADQDRCEGGLPRTLCCLPDGGGRHPTADVPRDFAADCRNYGRSPHPRQREARDCHAFTSNRREECVQMPAKIARLATRPPFWIPEVSVAVRSSRPSCSKAEKREY